MLFLDVLNTSEFEENLRNHFSQKPTSQPKYINRIGIKKTPTKFGKILRSFSKASELNCLKLYVMV